ncbi:hypothetical protein C9F11_09030 [Streptomyces sp. YIM 121038]|uniref:hypothetical protein n=1 Tax=Streptomyces sp. YIM 121038 TaxID=2136401 RepID=UPI001163CB77|nr:hypothetical protein [Streptomyces sp. YIM 121038]QCX75494.1 hypothetical protein C9F11_09030 [Streptomyces sp. YIM 121038]
MDSATSTYFNVPKKASTEAWAFEVARRRLRDGGVEHEAGDDRPTVSSRPSAEPAQRTGRKAPGSDGAQRLVDAARRADVAIEAAALVREIIGKAGPPPPRRCCGAGPSASVVVKCCP